MKTSETKKKIWKKPETRVLNIKKDTFSGSILGGEDPKANLGKMVKKVG